MLNITTHAGFISILGNPNAGKSTLLNALLDQKLAIVTPKIQTTRHRIKGIINDDQYQMVFNDTPGYIETKYKLHERMMDAMKSTLEDCDVLLLMHDIDEPIARLDPIIQLIKTSSTPCILLVNKIDKSNQERVLERISSLSPLHDFTAIIPISAQLGFNMDAIKEEIKKLLPISPWFYAEDEITDRNDRYFVSEIIREKIFIHCNKEIPYNVEVLIDSYKEEPAIHKIRAIILCGKESHKIILIGKGGSMLKRIGIEARCDIEKHVEQKVYLDLTVKVKENWRDDDAYLKRLGY